VQAITTQAARLPKGADVYDDEDNDDRFPDESPVDVRYPRSKQTTPPLVAGRRGRLRLAHAGAILAA
jgi:hypothetical protein